MKKRNVLILAGVASAAILGSGTVLAADKEGVTLQLLQFKEDQAAIVQAMVEDFNSQSNGITVEATVLGDDFSAT